LGVAIMGTLLAAQVSVGPHDPRYARQFVDGYHRALHFGAAVLPAGALVAVLTVRSRSRVERKPVAETRIAAARSLEEAARCIDRRRVFAAWPSGRSRTSSSSASV